MDRNIILSNTQIQQKIKRIAYQILEVCVKEKTVVLAGIVGNGFVFAQKLKKELNNISNIDCVLCEVIIDKKKPLNLINTSIKSEDYQGKSLILVDDVLNSGTTLIYGVKHFLAVPLKQLKTAVLVNRDHIKYPIKADFKGISLSTSIQEHVTVEFGKESVAYLA